MNLTQIIEKAESEYDKLPEPSIFPEALEHHHKTLKSFLSEKIKEAYEAGRNEGWLEAQP